MQIFINNNHNMEIAVIFTKILHDAGIVLGTRNCKYEFSYRSEDWNSTILMTFYHFQKKYIIFHLLSTMHFEVEWGMIVLMNFS